LQPMRGSQRYGINWACVAGSILFCTGGCGGPQRSYNVSLSLDHPESLERGQTVKSKCSAWGSEMGRFTATWYTGMVDVEIECPEGIDVTPSGLKLELKNGEWHNMATEEVTIAVHPRAKLGKHSITLSGKKADGKSAITQTREIEVKEAAKAGEPGLPK
jgi:hypothetical protein